MDYYYSSKEFLKRSCLEITGKTQVRYPTKMGFKKKTLDMTEVGAKHDGHYCQKDLVLCFVYKSQVYVTPYTKRRMSYIKRAGLEPADFFVPFTDGSYPAGRLEEWRRLKRIAQGANSMDYEGDCLDYSDKEGIGPIEKGLLAHCFQIPMTGVPVKSDGVEWVVYPLCNENRADAKAFSRIGKYSLNEESKRLIFVYRDGHTYVTRLCSIARELKEAGYEKANFRVPFVDGETITHRRLALIWEQT